MTPCRTCGACCAYFRVQFYWREANPEDQENAVPSLMVENLNHWFSCMKGTTAKHRPKCAALLGRIGRQVACSIYQQRPSPCRAFAASHEQGRANPRCDEARRAHGLPPLRRRNDEK